MTTYIEDLILELNNFVKVSSYDANIVSSFAGHIYNGRGFTEKQANLAIKLLKKYTKSLELATKTPITPFIQNPQYRFPIKKGNIGQAKRIYFTDHPVWNRCIRAEFPYNEERLRAIRQNKESMGLSAWDTEAKAWEFSVCEANIQFLYNLTNQDSFEYDEEFLKYVHQINLIVTSMEDHVPMVIFQENSYQLKNAPYSIPKFKYDNLIQALFQAKKCGVFTWDEQTNNHLETFDLHPVVKSFLQEQNHGIFDIDSTKEPIDCLKDIVVNMNPCLFVIPGGSELEKTKMIYNFLTGLGVTYDQISVMFRLPTQSGKNFNDFVKNCSLNNPITEKTKFVFISTKLPKPILQSKIKFTTIVNLGRSNVHYTIREFFKNRENLIYYCEPTKQRTLNFGIL